MSDVSISRLEKTSAYTYEVNLVVQVLASSREEADSLMETQGGHVSLRKVSFIRSAVVYDAISEADYEDAWVKAPTAEEEDEA